MDDVYGFVFLSSLCTGLILVYTNQIGRAHV